MDERKKEILDQVDFLSNKLSKCILDEVPHVLTAVVKDFYQMVPSSNQGQLTIDIFCRKNFKKTARKKIGKLFESSEWSVISNSKIPFADAFEILKICTKIDHDVEKLYNQCGELVYIEALGNEVSHEDFHGKNKINARKNDLIRWIKKVCDEMGKEFNNRDLYNQLKENFERNVKLIWNRKTSDWNEEDIFKTLIPKSRIELKEKYKLYSRPPTFIDNFEDVKIDEVITEVSLDIGGRKIHYEEVLKERNKKQIDCDSVVVISGHFGSGKTTLCTHYLKKWCEGKLFGPFYDLLFHLEIKNVHEDDIIHYIKANLIPTTYHYLNDDEILDHVLHRLKILFIIDGYDEKSQVGEKLVEDLLDKFPSKILITSRPDCRNEVFKKIKARGLRYLDINLEGFETTHRKAFIDKMWNVFEKKGISCGSKEEFLNFLPAKERIFGDLLKLPLFTVLFIFLWVNADSINRILSFTSLYNEIFKLLKKKLLAKLVSSDDTQNYPHLEKKIDKLFLIFANQCHRLHLANSYVIDSEFVDSVVSFCKKEKIDHIKCFSSFFLPQELRGKNLSQSIGYQFLHISQMEYLVGFHIISQVNLSQEFSRELLRGNSLEVMSFFIGQLNNKLEVHHIVDLFDKLKPEHNDFNSFWRILAETRYSDDNNQLTYNSKIISHLKGLLPKDEWKLTQSNVIAGLNLLDNGMRVRRLIIDLPPSLDPSDIPFFLDLLSSLKYSQKDQCINVELYLKSHSDITKREGSKSEDSSRFLRCFCPWGRIVKFCGFINCDFDEFSSSFSDIKSIKVRFTRIEPLVSFAKFLELKKPRLTKMEIIFDLDFKKTHKLLPLSATNAELYLHFHCVKRDDLNGIKRIIKSCTGEKGCERVYLRNAEFTPKHFTDSRFAHDLRGSILHKLGVISSVNFEEEAVRLLRKKLPFELTWEY